MGAYGGVIHQSMFVYVYLYSVMYFTI